MHDHTLSTLDSVLRETYGPALAEHLQPSDFEVWMRRERYRSERERLGAVLDGWL